MTRLNAKPSKYRAKPCEIDGIRFASQKEARRYQELRLLEKAGAIRCLECQPVFDLVVSVRTVGVKLKRAAARMRGQEYHDIGLHKVGYYIADFRYQDTATDGVIVEDVKGVRTAVYRLKKKIVEATYGITICEI